MKRPMVCGRVYRYGFNGKENDNEVKGDGNQQDYGMRVYDPRIGRFLSIDPITKKYPELTPYQFASNTPIRAIDQDGLEGMVPEEESRYERDREELEREELHRGLGFEESPEAARAREAFQKDPESYRHDVFRVLEELFREDALQFRVKQEIKLGKIDYRFANLRVQVLRIQERMDHEKASVLEENRQVSVISEGIVRKGIENNLKSDEILLSKPRIYIGDGKNEKDYATPDFAVFNTTSRSITSIIDAKNGGASLTGQQQRLNTLGGVFKGTSRVDLNLKAPIPVSPNLVKVERTSL